MQLSILVPLEGGYRNLRTKRLPLHLLRGLAVVIANMAFFTGLATLPLGEATANFFVAPLFITALSVPLLGERVGPRRWFARKCWRRLSRTAPRLRLRTYRVADGLGELKGAFKATNGAAE